MLRIYLYILPVTEVLLNIKIRVSRIEPGNWQISNIPYES